MARQYKNLYYLLQYHKHFTLEELEKLHGVPRRVIYDRINKLNWDIEDAVKEPVRKYGNKVHTVATDITPEFNEFFSNKDFNLCAPDYIGFDTNKYPIIIKFIDVKDNGVTPFESHPHRYPSAWYMFVLLIKFAKDLGGYLYIINYNSIDDKEYKIIKVVDYYKDRIGKFLKNSSNYCEYLNVENCSYLNKKQFKEWLNNLDSYNKNIKYNLYDSLFLKYGKKSSYNKFNKPSYYKNPIKSKDHLGNTYYSFTSMCNAYNINETTVRSRLNRGWDLEKALTDRARLNV